MIELVIGRESGVDNPRLAVTQNGHTQYFGAPGSVPKDVSRRHCRIQIGNDSKMTVEDITDNNFIYINGSDCKKKSGVSMSDTIELGPSKYRLDLDTIIKALSSNQSFSIRHLEAIYEGYQKDKFQMQVNQGKLNALSALPGVLSMISIGAAVFFQNQDVRTWAVILAAVFALAFAVIRYRNATVVPLKNKKMDESFREKYVCPNPLCGRFLGVTPYKELVKNRSCPYCKSKFTE